MQSQHAGATSASPTRRTGYVRVQPQARGAVLIAVMMLALVGALASAALLSRVEQSGESAAELVRRKRAFYAVDGMARIAIENTKKYMLTNGDPSTSDLQNASNVAVPTVPGYALEKFDISSGGAAVEAPITGGSFDGLNARQKPIFYKLLARENGTGTAASINLAVNIAQISMFQYFVFASGYLDLYPGPNMTVNPGRIHSNGDVCIGSDARLEIQYVTSAARVMASDSRCRRKAGKGAYINTGTTAILMDENSSSGCTNCANSGLAWQAYAESVLNRHVSDEAHGTPALKLPVTVTPAQAGLNAQGQILSNSESIRVLVDPVLSSDSASVKEQRYAWKADLRILNGVWYLNDGTWPGMPIWSDHPGKFATKNAEGIEGAAQNVGQADLALARTWTTVPKRYSYYEYDPIAGRLTDNAQGVISYGTLAANTLNGMVPGFWSKGANGVKYVDVDGKNHDSFCSACENTATCKAGLGLRDATIDFCQVSTTGGSFVAVPEAQRLQAARSGFLDYRVRNGDATRGAILPINVDVAELTRALQDTSSGELGSYFTGSRKFNGIVYVSYTWSGMLNGMPDELATLWPAQGAVLDNTQAASQGTAMVQRALPYPLCSDDLGYIPGTRRNGFSRPLSDGNDANGFEPLFTIPSCNSTDSPTSYPNAVRVMNAATLNRTVFPKGLSIVTSLPMYVQGNVNTSSTIGTTAVPCGSLTSAWVPFMVGGDAVSLLSTAWLDVNDPWDNSKGLGSRNSLDTIYNMTFISGNVETVNGSYYSGGVENFPRFLENWSGKTATINGAMVIGFSSVFQRQPWGGGGVYNAPVRVWSFDRNLELMSCQPPGTAMFNVHSFTYLEDSAL